MFTLYKYIQGINARRNREQLFKLKDNTGPRSNVYKMFVNTFKL